jgi:hypothetical protein
MTPVQLSDFDNFLFYGDGELLDEIQSDILIGLTQPKRSFFYNRQDSSGVPERENLPNSFVLQVGCKYDIVRWIGYRNGNVETGENGGKERRVAASQTAISFVVDGGNLDVTVQYIPLVNIQAAQTVAIPILQARG